MSVVYWLQANWLQATGYRLQGYWLQTTDCFSGGSSQLMSNPSHRAKGPRSKSRKPC
jgi:hypothetical protein